MVLLGNVTAKVNPIAANGSAKIVWLNLTNDKYLFILFTMLAKVGKLKQIDI